jgi:hypothetical protein
MFIYSKTRTAFERTEARKANCKAGENGYSAARGKADGADAG